MSVCFAAGQEERMKDACLNVMIKCLSYDFAGTSLDEAGEDIGTVQVRNQENA